jgi:SAM-dependent methyltransferase
MEHYTVIDKCRVCGCSKLEEIIAFKPQYLSATFVKSNENNPLSDIKIPQTLLFCTKCSLVQLKETVDPDLLYRDYFYRTDVNDTMKRDLKELVDTTVQTYLAQACLSTANRYRPVVVDIGANDGTMLRMFPKDWWLLGVEPATNIVRTRTKGDPIYWILQDYFTAEGVLSKLRGMTGHSPKKADIVTACACFYDMDPNKATGDIAKVLAPGGLAVIQVSHLLATVKAMNWYDVCLEHVVYYSLEVLDTLLERHGLSIVHATTNDVNGGSLRIFVRHADEVSHEQKSDEYWNIVADERGAGLYDGEWFEEFRLGLLYVAQKIVGRLAAEHLDGGSTCALGGSTKGNMLIQTLGLTKTQLPFISERSLVKIGMRTLGTDIPLISEIDARARKPTMMFVLPWCFKDEIVEREKEYIQCGGKLLFAMPYPYILDKYGEHKL